MSTIPNRYYNSPWIADAGRNLAAALAPPDPEKTLAAQREKWKFDRLQELAQIEDEERVAVESGNVSIGALLADAARKPTAPTSPGEAAFFSANPAAAGPAGMDDATFEQHIQTALRGKRPLAEVVTASGPRGSAYAAQRGLLDDKQAAAFQLREMQGDQSMGRAVFGAGAAMERARMTDDRIRDIANQNEQLRRELAILRGEQGAAHDARVTARGPGGGAPLDVSPTDSLNVGYNIQDFAEGLGVTTLPPELFNALKTRTNEIYQVTRNADTAQAQAVREILGDSPVVIPARDPWGPGDEDDYPASFQLRDGKTLGDILRSLTPAGGAAPAAAPAVVPAAPAAKAAPPPVATPLGGVVTTVDDVPPVEMFTPGEALQFEDGTVWKLINGVPTRVDNNG